jgi:allantoinase
MQPASVVRGERVVLPDGVRGATIHIADDGTILEVLPYTEPLPAHARVLDAGVNVILPGLVDTHVHINEPGRTEWEGFSHATRAAAAGGVTTLVDMPLNSVPPTTTVGGLEAKRSAAAGQCHVDVGFWGGVVPGNSGELRQLVAAGVRGFKCFMAPSGVDEFEHVSEDDLRQALAILASLNVPLLVHAELPSELRGPDGDPASYATWLASRPSRAETAAIDLLIPLAGEYGARVHIVHLATALAVPALRDARQRGIPVTVETCPHYLTFASEDIPDGAVQFKCAPPIRDAAQQEQLWRALADADVDMIATDHSPAPPFMKQGDFVRAWGGVASLQLGLAAVWTGASPRGFGFDHLARWMADAPARLAGLTGRKGRIAAGADADFAFWDPDPVEIVDASGLFHRHHITPYAGLKLKGRVVKTVLRGRVIFDSGVIVRPPWGTFI